MANFGLPLINTASNPQKPLRVFVGLDNRQPIALTVLAHSILVNSSQPVSITPLNINTLPIKKCGLTEFTFTRYLVPYLCEYEGDALFLDADMVVTGDIAELFALGRKQPDLSLHCVPVNRRFEWPSLMYFNNEHCKSLTLDAIVSDTNPPQSFSWVENGKIGLFPEEWNYCVGYSDFDGMPKLIHYTAGIPIWEETKNCKFADIWSKFHTAANSSVCYNDLMSSSVHHKDIVTNGAINVK